MNWITSGHLTNWADNSKKDCQNNITLLIRKLVRAGLSSINSASFPSGDNVQFEGWDGLLDISEPIEFLPLDRSVWEIGTTQKIKEKANDDFEKRSKNPLGVNQIETTFVFVTPRVWVKKAQWLKEKKEKGLWKDVRVIDGRDLEEWIEKFPAVGVWLAVHLNLSPRSGFTDPETSWIEWATGNDFRLVPDLLVGGRELESLKLLTDYRNPSIIPIQASSIDEAIYFVIAVFLNNERERLNFFSKSIIVDSEQSFRELVNLVTTPMIIIAKFDNDNALNYAKAKGHTILVPLDNSTTSAWSDVINLPSLDRVSFINSLVKSGLTVDDAENVSKDSTRNITLFRRLLKFNHVDPDWSKKRNFLTIIPALLAGRWDENNFKDKEIISLLSGEDYGSYISKLKTWCDLPDSPTILIGEMWRLTSPLDAWTHLGRHCTAESLKTFRDLVLIVLSSVDTQVANQSEIIHYLNKKYKYSKLLTNGLIQSLIIISVYGKRLKIMPHIDTQSWVDSTIYSIISNDSFDFWKTISSSLPLIAEAAPVIFLDSIENQLSVPQNAILPLFVSERNSFANHSNHSELLLALEEIAWDPLYLSRVVLILGNLAENASPTSPLSSPLNSLRQIFRIWLPQTFASKEDRFSALRLLTKERPIVAWQLIITLLRNPDDVCQQSYKMRWRLKDDYIYKDVTWQEMTFCYSGVVDLLIDLFENNENQFNDLIIRSVKLSPWDNKKLLMFLNTRIPFIPFTTNSNYLALAKLISHHKTYPTQKWALPKETLLQYEQIFDQLKPKDEIERDLFVFLDEYPQFTDIEFLEMSYEDRFEEIMRRRVESFKKIYEQHGFEKTFALTTNVLPSQIKYWAFAAAQIITDPQQQLELFYRTLEGNSLQLDFIRSYSGRKTQLENIKWLFTIYSLLSKPNQQLGNLEEIFLNVLPCKELWQFLENVGEELNAKYWNKVNIFTSNIEDVSFSVEKLLQVDRNVSAVYQVAHTVDFLDINLIIRVLEKFIIKPHEAGFFLNGYELDLIFRRINNLNIDRSVLVTLEWKFILYLKKSNESVGHPNLEKELAENPLFFIKILDLAHLPDSGENLELYLKSDEFRQNREDTIRANELLGDWKLVVGCDDQGKLDALQLNGWISVVREKSKLIDKFWHANSEIGKMLAHYPEIYSSKFEHNVANFDDAKLDCLSEGQSWPPDIICDLLQSINNKEMLSSFKSEILSKYAFTMRMPDSGGDIERARAFHFKILAANKAANFPKVASVLEEISKTFLREAPQADINGTINRLEN